VLVVTEDDVAANKSMLLLVDGVVCEQTLEDDWLLLLFFPEDDNNDCVLLALEDDWVPLGVVMAKRSGLAVMIRLSAFSEAGRGIVLSESRDLKLEGLLGRVSFRRFSLSLLPGNKVRDKNRPSSSWLSSGRGRLSFLLAPPAATAAISSASRDLRPLWLPLPLPRGGVFLSAFRRRLRLL